MQAVASRSRNFCLFMYRRRTMVRPRYKHIRQSGFRSHPASVRWCLQIALIFAAFTTTAPLHASGPEFMPLEAARPVLQKMASGNGAQPRPNIAAQDWLAWLQESDRQVRQRLEVGEEDTLTNLLRFGVTYTKEYRIEDDYLVLYGQSSLVNAFAENRANDLIRALEAPHEQSGLRRDAHLPGEKGFLPQLACGAEEAQSVPAGESGADAERVHSASGANQNRPQPEIRTSGHFAG